MDDAALARVCADAMWTEDATSRGLGIRLISVSPGEALVFARSATVGGQRFPVHWGGDSVATGSAHKRSNAGVPAAPASMTWR